MLEKRRTNKATKTANHPLSSKQVHDIISSQFPSLPLEQIDHIQQGGDSFSYEINQRWIFRFPKTAVAAAKMTRERALLAALGPTLPLSVPLPHYIGRSDDRYPYSFTGHRKVEGISGETLRPDPENWPAVAAQLGGFLARLHQFPGEQARLYQLEVVPPEPPEQLLTQAMEADCLIKRTVLDLITADIEQYLSGRAAVPPISSVEPVLCHADFKGEHFLISKDGRSLSGIIDWSDICLTDPAVDFAGLMIWLGEAFVRQVLDHYTFPVDKNILAQAGFIARCRALINLGKRLAGETDAPLDLLLTQMNWAFS